MAEPERPEVRHVRDPKILRDELSAPAVLQDALRRLALRIQFPGPLRALVGRVQDWQACHRYIRAASSRFPDRVVFTVGLRKTYPQPPYYYIDT